MYRLKRLHLAPPPVTEGEGEAEEVVVGGGGGGGGEKGKYYWVDKDNYSSCYYDIGEFIYDAGTSFSSLAVPSVATPLDATTVLVAFKCKEEPVLKILRPGAGKWVEHRYADDHRGWAFLDVCAFDGRLYAVTTHGKIAEIVLAGDGGVEVELLESEESEEEEEQVWGIGKVVHHVFDVLTDADSHLLEVAADGWGIRWVTVYW